MKIRFLIFSLLWFLIASAQQMDTTSIGYTTISSNSLVKVDTNLSFSILLELKDFTVDESYDLLSGSQVGVRNSLNIFKAPNYISPNFGLQGLLANHGNVKDVPFYNTRVPLGEMRFLTGYGGGQMFGIMFTVNPVSRLNVFIDYQRTNSEGIYFRQDGSADRLKSSMHYQSKSGRYLLYGALTWNGDNLSENGGINDLSEFETNEFGSQKELLSVNLYNSSIQLRGLSGLLNNEYVFTKNDSNQFRLGVFHELRVDQNRLVFRSQDSLYTSAALFDVEEIKDSINFINVSNDIGLHLKTKSFDAKGGLSLSNYSIGNDYMNDASYTAFVFAEADMVVTEQSEFHTDGKLGLINEFAGTYDINLDYKYKFNGDFAFSIGLAQSSLRPGLFAKRYVSNNFIWNNQSFKNTSATLVKAKVKYQNFFVQGKLEQLQNLVIYDENSLPFQINDNALYASVEAGARFPIVEHLSLDNLILFQHTDSESYIRVPDWRLRHILYYQIDLFQNALETQFGLEFSYFSKYFANTIQPATSVMYLQNEQEIGNFPYFNFHVNFKIKELIFYVRLENITQGLFEYNYYALPGYPMADFTVRVGAKWRFFN